MEENLRRVLPARASGPGSRKNPPIAVDTTESLPREGQGPRLQSSATCFSLQSEGSVASMASDPGSPKNSPLPPNNTPEHEPFKTCLTAAFLWVCKVEPQSEYYARPEAPRKTLCVALCTGLCTPLAGKFRCNREIGANSTDYARLEALRKTLCTALCARLCTTRDCCKNGGTS